ncbi:MAG: SGNH/GDSL hydrolase family protein [Saccharofermentans sp.]|nr:SGNH/GDSL hydrolase family protein [Saccharofermentans sp.]
MINILCYGDSNTYGYDPDTGLRFAEETRWTGVLQNLLGSEYNVICEGLNGRTTVFDDPEDDWKNGLNYVRGICCTHRPVDVFVVMLGTNDCKKCFAASPDQIAGGMEQVVTSAITTLEKKQGYRPKVLIVAPSALGDVSKGPFAASFDDDSIARSKDLANLYEVLSISLGTYYIDASKVTAPSETDGVHLTGKGHKLLGTAIGYAILKDIC